MADKKFVPPPPVPDEEPAFTPPPPTPDAESKNRTSATHGGMNAPNRQELRDAPPLFPALAKQGDNPSFDNAMGAGAEVLKTGGLMASPMIGPSAIASPFRAAIGIGAGVPVSEGVEWAGDKVGLPGTGSMAGLAAGGLTASRIPVLDKPGLQGAAKSGYEALKDIPFFGKMLRLPEAVIQGYRNAPRPLPDDPPEWFLKGGNDPGGPVYKGELPGPLPARPALSAPTARLESKVPDATPIQLPGDYRGVRMPSGKVVGPVSRVTPTPQEPAAIAPLASGRPSPAGLPNGAAVPQSTEVKYIQHLGDMRINGRTPAPPKMYDAFGRLIPPSQ